jgi:diguanylate cyclase (GGDEF)-like protein
LTDVLSNLFPVWLRGLRATALALLDESGNIVEANEGFLAPLPPQAAGGVAADFILDPPFFRWPQFPAGQDDVIYEGLIQIGAKEGFYRTISGRIYRMQTQFLLVAEIDISAFEKLNGELDSATREIEELRRQINRRNQALQKAQEQLQEARQKDPLTDLALKTKLFERMEEEILRWERYRRPLAVVMIDLDHFGEVNNDYGREVGDEVLRHVATITQQSIRSLDVAARYGGQEFAVLLPETNEMGALIVAERLRMELDSLTILPLIKPLTASFGVAMLIEGEKRKDFCARAERAMRFAKQNGRNCVTMAGVISECDYVYNGTQRKSDGTTNI